MRTEGQCISFEKLPLLLLLPVLLYACGSENEEETDPTQKEGFRDSILKENRRMARVEERAIEDYIERRDWDMEQSGTGLRYMIQEKGEGRKAEKGMVAKVNYRVELLTGKLCYSSEESGPKTFLIGRDDEVTGLHEGIRYMREGGKAVFIMPAHLAHGLLGDMEKIPVHASLVYRIELLELRRAGAA